MLSERVPSSVRHELEIVNTFRDRIFSDASSWHDVEIGDERNTNNFHPMCM